MRVTKIGKTLLVNVADFNALAGQRPRPPRSAPATVDELDTRLGLSHLAPQEAAGEPRAELAGALDAFARTEGRDRARAYVAVIEGVFATWPAFQSSPAGRELERRRQVVVALETLRAALRGLGGLFAAPGGSS